MKDPQKNGLAIQLFVELVLPIIRFILKGDEGAKKRMEIAVKKIVALEITGALIIIGFLEICKLFWELVVTLISQ